MADIKTTLDNIQGHWTLDDVLTDSTANGNDLTHSGAATYAVEGARRVFNIS